LLDHIFFKIRAPRFDILNYLFYRKKKYADNRMTFRNRECYYHRGSSACCYEFYDPTGVVQSIYRCILMFPNKDDMLANVYSEIVGRYYIEKSTVKVRKEFHYATYLSFYRQYYASKSSIALRPPTSHTNPILETSIFPSQFIRPLVKILSDQYIMDVSRIQNVVPGSLVDRCLRVLRWDEIVYENFSYCMDFQGNYVGPTFPRVVFSTNNMTASKQARMMKGFGRDTARRGPTFQLLRRYLPPALRAMSVALDTQKYVGRLHLQWNPKEALNWVNLNTGGGLSIAKTGTIESRGNTIMVHDTGKKIFLIESSLKHVHEFIMSVLLGKPIYLIDLEAIRAKQEWRKASKFSYEDLVKLMEKMREFFCPSLNLIIFSDFLMRDRRKIETGRMIRIGMNFNHGGADILYKYLHGGDKNFFWVDGDITEIDKSIQDWMLMLYIATGSKYYAWQDYDEKAQEKIEFFVKTLMYKISHKIVLHLGNFWQFMRGVMHSGGKDTSHGDSWIMSLMFYLYCMEVIDRNPHIADLVMNCLVMGIIVIVVYGDDHIWASLQVLRAYMNAKGWTEFLGRVCHMVLRDAKEYDSFLSIVDHQSGTYIYRGPVFLKRRFIESFIPGSAPVVPFKDIHETMINLFLKDDADVIDYMLSCVGQMYDTMGTNVVAYRYVKRFFDLVCNYYVITNPLDMLKKALEDPERQRKIAKYMRRLHMTDMDIWLSIPSLGKLQSWHKFDPEKSDFGGVDLPNFYEFAF